MLRCPGHRLPMPCPVARPDGRLPGIQTDSGSAKHSFVEISREIISTAILSLPLIQVGQLAVTGERM